MEGGDCTGRGNGAKGSVPRCTVSPAKSSTAQVVAIKRGEKYDRSKVRERHRDHALFVAFAPPRRQRRSPWR